jgi:hypothetical protein
MGPRNHGSTHRVILRVCMRRIACNPTCIHLHTHSWVLCGCRQQLLSLEYAGHPPVGSRMVLRQRPLMHDVAYTTTPLFGVRATRRFLTVALVPRVVTASSVRLYSSSCTYKLYPSSVTHCDGCNLKHTPPDREIASGRNDRAKKDVFEEGEIDVWRAAINKAMQK